MSEVVASLGNFIGGKFVFATGDEITSFNPAQNFEPVFTTHCSLEHVEKATCAANEAFKDWSAKSQEERNAKLAELKAAFVKREADMARTITLEMGKPIAESEAEAKNLSARIDLTINHALPKVATHHFEGLRGEARYHPQGPVAVLGPYNFPAHLVNAHVIPALLTGNTVVVKPSEVCPLVAQVYAECVMEAGLPDGVFNMVQGRADVGQALVCDPHVRAVLFTGSYATGRAIQQTLLDHPRKIAALEMGGKNIAVVLDDADLYQALSEILQGAFLTTGQRCTATSRVFLHRAIADQFISALIKATRLLKPSDPMRKDCAFGPLATQKSLERYLNLIEQAPKSGAEVLQSTEALKGGAFVTPSIHLLKQVRDENAYIREELFGPDICIEIVDDLDDAISRTNKSVYGLSNALFSASQSAFEKFYRETSSGVLNFNRSTNGALGQLPFGGVGKSGNQRAAGIDAVRYTTYPVAINHLPYGETEPTKSFAQAMHSEQDMLDISVESLVARHRLESFLALRGIQIHDARGRSVLISLAKLSALKVLAEDARKSLQSYAHIDDQFLWVTVPSGDSTQFTQVTEEFFSTVFEQNATELSRITRAAMQVPARSELPQSAAMLNRLYKDNFLPREKKTPVIDLRNSKGPYLCSIDDEPLVLFDAASQIASLGAGFQSGIFLDALDTNQLTSAVIANVEDRKALEEYSQELLSHAWKGVNHVTFTSSGAEANEKAIDLCRTNGTKGKRVIAFEGSFHGRTLLALQATFNPQKRGLFEFAGYEATFVPFPSWLTPQQEPEFSPSWVKGWFEGRAIESNGDELLAREIASLLRVKEEIEKGDVACVIVEPMQCEGGDNYATARFFNGLRALTRGLGVPLVFDEVQTGFSLLGPFFAHTGFNLRDAHGKVDGPDCITMAKKAQLGVVLSAWPDTRPQPCHNLQVQRGIRHAQALKKFNIQDLHADVTKRLDALQKKYPDFISNPRAKGFAFAFDLPTAHLATQIINQRFYRGYMVYIAGEKTMRFRLNTKTTGAELDQLFSAISSSFEHVRNYLAGRKDLASYISPAWEPAKDALERSESKASYTFLKLDLDTFEQYRAEIAKLEEEAYEPNRRDTMEYLQSFVAVDDGLALLMLDSDGNPIGYAIGGPLEHSHVDGPKQDPLRGTNRAFYSTNVMVSPKFRGQKLGYALKQAQLDHVRRMKTADGKPRYDYLCGRNRVGFTAEMGAVNRTFGAYTVTVYDKQYGDDNGKALYYRIPLRGPVRALRKPEAKPVLDWSSPIQAPFGESPEALFDDLENGKFTGAIATKLTLSNFITPDFVRYAELLRRLAPNDCKHAYFTSGRDEVNDKAVRCLRVSRPQGQVVLGLRQQFFGTTTAVSRSLTEPSEYASPFSWFDWPLVTHPSEDWGASLKEIQKAIAQQGADKVLGIFVELIGEKTATPISPTYLLELDKIRKETGVPIVFVETASAFGRSGETLFYSDAQPIRPNLVLWYTGAQLGHVFTDDQYYVSKPLTLISTWDGDEISMLRTYRHLLLARKTLEAGLAEQFDDLLTQKGIAQHAKGIGLWRCIKAPNLITEAQKRGLILAAGFGGRTMITPHLGSTKADLERGVDILRSLL